MEQYGKCSKRPPEELELLWLPKLQPKCHLPGCKSVLFVFLECVPYSLIGIHKEEAAFRCGLYFRLFG